ncbi:MAG: hypothetical protein H5T69_21715, partial [Chloroflexi bacterium]|nr:hypothetical protein [Chloroflexota bacterium]
ECWQTEEADPSGIYKATYKKLVGGKDTISFIKSKISYKSAEKADEEPKLNPKIVPKGEIRIEYAFRVGKPISLKGNDELEIFIVDRKVGNIKTDVILNLISIENISEAETSALQNVYIERKTLLRKLPLYQKLSGGEETIYRKILGDTKLDNLLGELSEIEQGETKD